MLAVLRQRNYALLWFGGLISMLGDWVLFVGLPYEIFRLTPVVYVTPGAWKPSRVARLAKLPREFNGKRLVTHQRDAIRMTIYAIDKRKERREEH